MRCHHYVLTPSAYGGQPADVSARRLALTEAVTLPSLQSQTNRAFTWIVAVARGDERRRRLLERSGLDVEIVEFDGPGRPPSHAIWWDAVASRLPEEATHVLSTRLDDDDALAVDAVDRIQHAAAACPAAGSHILEIPQGYRLSADGWAPHHRPLSQFSSMLAPRHLQRVVRCTGHGRLASYGTPRLVDEEPAWIWTRHADALSPGGFDGNTRDVARLPDRFRIDWQRALPLLAEPIPFRPANRIGLMNWLIATRGYRRYLEIGVAGERTFAAIEAPHKVGIDPVRGGTHRMSSDDYFAQHPAARFDLVFVDGLHLTEQLLRDVNNSLRRLAPGGVIVVHDCLPRRREHQLRHRETATWNGDVWKAIVALRQRPAVDTAVSHLDWGLGLVLPRPNSDPLPVIGRPLTWPLYRAERNRLLRVMAWPALRRWLERASA